MNAKVQSFHQLSSFLALFTFVQVLMFSVIFQLAQVTSSSSCQAALSTQFSNPLNKLYSTLKLMSLISSILIFRESGLFLLYRLFIRRMRSIFARFLFLRLISWLKIDSCLFAASKGVLWLGRD